jgi:2,3-bisphosphoglycerate-independent phosphoglycerate mutase
MSAQEVTDIVLSRINAADGEQFILVNYANGDMVGHTGKLDAAIKAVETVDECVGKLVDAVRAKGGVLIVTADHGNAEQMFDPETGSPHTAHTTYDVECILVDERLKALASGNAESPSKKLKAGRLADICPTVLKMMGLEQPTAMTGEALYEAPFLGV